MFIEDNSKRKPDASQSTGKSRMDASAPLIGFVTVQITWVRRDSSTESTVLQGVAADYSSGTTSSAVRLGVFDRPEFSGELAPDGTPVLQEATFTTPASHDDIAEVRISTSVDSFLDLNGDINGDGVVCLDDLDLMLALNGATLGETHDPLYNARADFDLNGVINDNDQLAFAERFSALRDCNANGSPDECDIAYGVSNDANLNGIPDECEPGDLNCDGVRDGLDVHAFVLALTAPNDYEVIYTSCDIGRADLDESGTVDTDDIQPFIALMLASAGI